MRAADAAHDGARDHQGVARQARPVSIKHQSCRSRNTHAEWVIRLRSTTSPWRCSRRLSKGALLLLLCGLLTTSCDRQIKFANDVQTQVVERLQAAHRDLDGKRKRLVQLVRLLLPGLFH